MSYESKYQRYRRKHREKCREYSRDYYNKHKQAWPKYNLQARYGITPEDYDRLYEEQQGGCAICGKHQSKLKKALSVDHNHKTGQIRGLLCNRCNLLLGNVSDNSIILRSAADYLDKYEPV